MPERENWSFKWNLSYCIPASFWNVWENWSLIYGTCPTVWLWVLEWKIQYTPRMQYIPRKIQYTPRKIQYTPRKIQHTPRKIQHTPSKIQHTSRKIQYTPRKIQYTPRMQYIPSSSYKSWICMVFSFLSWHDLPVWLWRSRGCCFSTFL